MADKTTKKVTVYETDSPLVAGGLMFVVLAGIIGGAVAIVYTISVAARGLGLLIDLVRGAL